MRSQSPEEAELLGRRRALFERFETESIPALIDLGRALGASPPELIVANPELFVPAVEQMLANEDVAAIPPDERRWLQSRLTYLVGQIFARRHRGTWIIQEDPDSRNFAQFLVGRFGDGTRPQACMNPAEVMRSYLTDSPGQRNLAALLAEVESELTSS